MPASKIPSPDMNTKRIYYRDENNVSKPFGWISDDHSLILLDEGEVLSRQSEENLINRNGVGILSYHRLVTKITDRTKLYIPNNIERMFEQYSNKLLLAKGKNKSTLKSLLQKRLDNSAITIVSLIQKYNAGLEQEILHN